jgi:Tol biopolymer transport system component
VTSADAAAAEPISHRDLQAVTAGGVLLLLLVVSGAGASRATATFRIDYADPAWSPRGSLIAFVQRSTVTDGPIEQTVASVVVMKPDGSGVRAVATVDSGRTAWPTWSPDGRKIAFGNEVLYVVNSDGTRLRELARGGCCAAWGPGGRRIAFSTGPESQGEVFVVNPDGSDRRLAATPDEDHSFWGTTWSPHGQKLAFFADEAPDIAANAKTALAVVQRYGGRVRRIATCYCAEPAWSPDGRKIAVSGIRVFDLASRRFSSLRQGTHPSWSPNGRQIAFASRNQIFVMNADGSNLRQLTHSP